jgi:hypothetical protein
MQINDIFCHFKGKEYRIVGMSYSSEGNHLVPRVEYADLETGMRFSRPLSNFLEIVERDDFKYKGPRFVFVRKD